MKKYNFMILSVIGLLVLIVSISGCTSNDNNTTAVKTDSNINPMVLQELNKYPVLKNDTQLMQLLNDKNLTSGKYNLFTISDVTSNSFTINYINAKNGTIYLDKINGSWRISAWQSKPL